MGNRAHVIFTDGDRISPAVYLHWNGGPESVYAFLDEMGRRGVRKDTHYAPARFCQIVGEFFSSEIEGSKNSREGSYGLSLGIINGPVAITPSALEPYDHGDNGVYVVTWTRVGYNMRRFTSGPYNKLVEWTPEKRQLEVRRAYESPYGPSIADGFAELESFRTKEATNGNSTPSL